MPIKIKLVRTNASAGTLKNPSPLPSLQSPYTLSVYVVKFSQIFSANVRPHVPRLLHRFAKVIFGRRTLRTTRLQLLRSRISSRNNHGADVHMLRSRPDGQPRRGTSNASVVTIVLLLEDIVRDDPSQYVMTTVPSSHLLSSLTNSL